MRKVRPYLYITILNVPNYFGLPNNLVKTKIDNYCMLYVFIYIFKICLLNNHILYVIVNK